MKEGCDQTLAHYLQDSRRGEKDNAETQGPQRSAEKSGGRGIHPRCDGKSAQRIDCKGVEECPLRKRVRKIKKRKGMGRELV
jgi:hypothetical protein